MTEKSKTTAFSPSTPTHDWRVRPPSRQEHVSSKRCSATTCATTTRLARTGAISSRPHCLSTTNHASVRSAAATYSAASSTSTTGLPEGQQPVPGSAFNPFEVDDDPWVRRRVRQPPSRPTRKRSAKRSCHWPSRRIWVAPKRQQSTASSTWTLHDRPRWPRWPATRAVPAPGRRSAGRPARRGGGGGRRTRCRGWRCRSAGSGSRCPRRACHSRARGVRLPGG